MEDGQGEAFLSREEWALQRAGEETDPAVADADRDELARRSLVRHAPSRPQWTSQLADKGVRRWHQLVVTHGNRFVAPISPNGILRAN
ncbi:hypothetical protein A6R70_23070 [Agrobacterium rubi]|nr:hypothetical protein [Agrobacterium rubi]